MKNHLIQIAQEVVDLEKALIESQGEITETIQDKLKIKELELPAKIDGYAHIIKRLDITADHFRKQAMFFSSVAKGIEAANDRLRDNLKNAMEIMAINELNGQSFRFKMSPTQPAVIVDNVDQLPPDFYTLETVKRPDKKAIAKAFLDGVTLDGVRLEPNASLRIYPMKG